jgi:hypothetical protein
VPGIGKVNGCGTEEKSIFVNGIKFRTLFNKNKTKIVRPEYGRNIRDLTKNGGLEMNGEIDFPIERQIKGLTYTCPKYCDVR